MGDQAMTTDNRVTEHTSLHDACTRCGHDAHLPPSATERLRRAIGRKPQRVPCGQPTELGRCPCRSRFHV